MGIKVFVYGTLRDAAKPATHVLTGYGLFRYSWFPFLAPHEGGVVYGNVLTITEDELHAYDMYESVPSGLYKRIKVKVVALGKDKETKVWVYVPDNLLEGDDTQYPLIESGDWFKQ